MKAIGQYSPLVLFITLHASLRVTIVMHYIELSFCGTVCYAVEGVSAFGWNP